MRKYPFYKQFDAMDCGPACLRMIAKYFGKIFRDILQRIGDHIRIESFCQLIFLLSVFHLWLNKLFLATHYFKPLISEILTIRKQSTFYFYPGIARGYGSELASATLALH